jgi:hypothetical protein
MGWEGKCKYGFEDRRNKGNKTMYNTTSNPSMEARGPSNKQKHPTQDGLDLQLRLWRPAAEASEMVQACKSRVQLG